MHRCALLVGIVLVGGCAGDEMSAGAPEPPAGGGPPIPGGNAQVRLCHRLTESGAPTSAEVQIGPVSLKATTDQCAPAAGTGCAAAPSGSQPLRLRVGARDLLDAGTTDLEPGGAYLVVLDVLTVGGKTIVVPRTVELESAADCNGLDG